MSDISKLPNLTRPVVNAARKRLAESSLFHFTKMAWKLVNPGSAFVDGWHIRSICQHLEAVSNCDIRRLLINVPPRHMKSLAVGVFWPCWRWTKHPEESWIFSSYSDDICVRDTNKCRLILESDWYQSNWPMVLKQSTNHQIQNGAMGHRIARTVGGATTGEGADYIVVDDPMKAADAHSVAAVDNVIRWWTGTMATRQQDPKTTRRVIIMQRLRENDLSGYVIEQDGYEHLCYPARYDPDHPFANKRSCLGVIDPRVGGPVGAPLWPERFGENELRDLEREINDPLAIAGQLQQQPAPADGDIFQKKHFQYFSTDRQRVGDGSKEIEVFVIGNERRIVPFESCLWFQTVDTALTKSDQSAYSVVVTVAVTPAPVSILVYDIARDRIEVPEQLAWILAQKTKNARVAFQAVEQKASGIGLIQETRLVGSPFVPLKADVDKVRRSLTISNQYRNKIVYHRTPSEAPWLTKFETELLLFPVGQFADQVDCMSYVGMIVQGQMFSGQQSSQSLADVRPENESPEETERANKLARLLTGRDADYSGKPSPDADAAALARFGM